MALKDTLNLLRNGFDFVGNADLSGVFDVDPRPAELTVK